jgi:hypothetical protein
MWKLIGWLCMMGAGISMLAGMLSGHFAPHRRKFRGKRSAFQALMGESAPGFVQSALLAAVLLALGLLFLVI